MSTTADVIPMPDRPPGRPLQPWTYTNSEFFELDYEAFFLRRWQFVGHESDIPEAGDYIAADIGRDNVFVLHGKDGTLRAFKNVCRHRASRVVEGKGSCRGVIRCPYHGWTYRLDGSLMAIPQEERFEDFDRSQFGLHEIELESFYGLLFARVIPGGESVAEQFADTGHYFEKYGVSDYVPCAETTTQIWPVNWKVAWDNYMENYHIPIGHPGLNRLVVENEEYGELSSGVSWGTFVLRDKPSKVDVERRYQELAPHGQARVPEELRNKWVQFGVAGSLGIDMYPEMLDIFKLIPLGVDKTMVLASYYGHRDPTPQEEELRRANVELNDIVNDEDRTLCTRVQNGLGTSGYRPGPLSDHELGVFNFHEMVRELVPVASLDEAPAVGSVATENLRLSAKA